jgi:hypothetical protein
MAAMRRLRSDPADVEAEPHLADVLHNTSEMLLTIDGLADTDEVVFMTIATPIFDPIGRVLLSLSVTGPARPVPVVEVLELGRRMTQAASIATRQSRGRPPARAVAADRSA